MRVKKIIKEIAFTEDIRPELTLGPNVRMNPDVGKLMLKEGATGYPLDADLYAITPLVSPQSVKQWVGFDVIDVHQYDEDGQPVTSLGYRLSDDTNQYWYDGADWVVNTTSWNTEAEVADHIDSWPANERKIKIVINLRTTSAKATPVVEKIKLLYNSNIEFQEDLVSRSIIPLMKQEIRPISEIMIPMETTSNTIYIGMEEFDGKYDITAVDSVYDNANDPTHFNDLFDSYDEGTKIITLKQPIQQDDDAWVNFIYRPLVATSTDTEYSSDAEVPAVHITDVNTDRTIESFQGDSVRNKSQGTAIKIPSAAQKDMSFSVQLLAAFEKDLQRLADEIRTFFVNNRMITSVGLDEKYPALLTSDVDIKTGQNENTLHFGTFRFRVLKALFYQEKDETAYVIVNFNITGDMDVTIN